jgi:hypothetical protein
MVASNLFREKLGRRSALGLATGLLLFTPTSCKRLFGNGDGTKMLISAPDKNGRKRALSVPTSWSEDVERNPAAEIASGSRSDDTFAMVICEPKGDFPGYTLDRYSDLTRAQVMKNLTGGKSSAKVKLTIAEHAAIETELRGGFRDGSPDDDGGARTTNLVYLHTSVELEASYCQVVGWTNGRRWDSASTLLRKVAASFHEEG